LAYFAAVVAVIPEACGMGPGTGYLMMEKGGSPEERKGKERNGGM